MYNFGGGGGTEFDSRGASESIADINPEDIESMSVLTGAAAAALYGSNAANGAIMITTKKGKAGALKVTLSSNTEFLDPFVQPEFQNRYGTGSNGVRSGSGIYSWGQKLLPAARYGYTPADFFETGTRVHQRRDRFRRYGQEPDLFFPPHRSIPTASFPTTNTIATTLLSATPLTS